MKNYLCTSADLLKKIVTHLIWHFLVFALQYFQPINKINHAIDKLCLRIAMQESNFVQTSITGFIKEESTAEVFFCELSKITFAEYFWAIRVHYRKGLKEVLWKKAVLEEFVNLTGIFLRMLSL